MNGIVDSRPLRDTQILLCKQIGQRLDRDFYVVLEDFAGGAAFRETDEGIAYPTLIEDLLRGEYGSVRRVVARRVGAEGREISDQLQDFLEGQLGRKIGVQLPLPLQI